MTYWKHPAFIAPPINLAKAGGNDFREFVVAMHTRGGCLHGAFPQHSSALRLSRSMAAFAIMQCPAPFAKLSTLAAARLALNSRIAICQHTTGEYMLRKYLRHFNHGPRALDRARGHKLF